MAKGCVSAAEAEKIKSSGTSRTMSESHKEAIADSKRGKTLSSSHKQAISEGMKSGAATRKSSGSPGRCPKGTYSSESLKRSTSSKSKIKKGSSTKSTKKKSSSKKKPPSFDGSGFAGVEGVVPDRGETPIQRKEGLASSFAGETAVNMAIKKINPNISKTQKQRQANTSTAKKIRKVSGSDLLKQAGSLGLTAKPRSTRKQSKKSSGSNFLRAVRSSGL